MIFEWILMRRDGGFTEAGHQVQSLEQPLADVLPFRRPISAKSA
jgi:hypothetical protein